MRFLIWTVCVVIAALLMVLTNELELFMGALWQTLIFAAMITTATVLCKKLDKKRQKEYRHEYTPKHTQHRRRK